jgi:hypothetical protein
MLLRPRLHAKAAAAAAAAANQTAAGGIEWIMSSPIQISAYPVGRHADGTA